MNPGLAKFDSDNLNQNCFKEYPEHDVVICSAECQGDCTVEWDYERPTDGRVFRKTLSKSHLLTLEEWDEITGKYGHSGAECPDCGSELRLQEWWVFSTLMDIYDEAQEQLMEKLDEQNGGSTG